MIINIISVSIISGGGGGGSSTCSSCRTRRLLLLQPHSLVQARLAKGSRIRRVFPSRGTAGSAGRPLHQPARGQPPAAVGDAGRLDLSARTHIRAARTRVAGAAEQVEPPAGRGEPGRAPARRRRPPLAPGLACAASSHVLRGLCSGRCCWTRHTGPPGLASARPHSGGGGGGRHQSIEACAHVGAAGRGSLGPQA